MMEYHSENTAAAPIDGGIGSANTTGTLKGNFPELPEGLAMAFAQDTAALRRFTDLSVTDQDDVIRRARSVSTRDEMRRLIETF